VLALSNNRFRIAIDIGGTFTDIALLTDAGLIHQSKISSTPADPSVAVIEGVGQLLAELSIPPGAIAEVLHGTTVGSNTILQRKGAKTGLITTRGFRDVLEIGRIRMPDMFDLTWEKPQPLVPRRHRMEVTERMASDGSFQAIGIGATICMPLVKRTANGADGHPSQQAAHLDRRRTRVAHRSNRALLGSYRTRACRAGGL
jgi:N-methylhydantoinase A/oxoprolinase/acetone carboxylase beta subunit